MTSFYSVEDTHIRSEELRRVKVSVPGSTYVCSTLDAHYFRHIVVQRCTHHVLTSRSWSGWPGNRVGCLLLPTFFSKDSTVGSFINRYVDRRQHRRYGESVHRHVLTHFHKRISCLDSFHSYWLVLQVRYYFRLWELHRQDVLYQTRYVDTTRKRFTVKKSQCTNNKYERNDVKITRVGYI